MGTHPIFESDFDCLTEMLTLKYFSIKGRGEVARLILTAGNVPFKDERYDFTMRPAKNPETNRRLGMYEHPVATYKASDWLKRKASYPFQALPVLENVPGIDAPICQSRAITRYCAKLAGMGGSDENMQLKADMFADIAYEWFERTWTKYSFLIGTQNGSMKAEDRWKRYDMVTGLLEPEVDDFIARFEQLHKQHCGENSPFVAGEQLTFADMYWLVTRDFLVDQGFGDRVESAAPSLNRIANSVSKLPSVSQYYDENKRNGFVAMGFAF